METILKVVDEKRKESEQEKKRKAIFKSFKDYLKKFLRDLPIKEFEDKKETITLLIRENKNGYISIQFDSNDKLSPTNTDISTNNLNELKRMLINEIDNLKISNRISITPNASDNAYDFDIVIRNKIVIR